MSFEVYAQCFGEKERTGVPRAVVRSLFPVSEAESEPDYWLVRYDAENSCHIGVTALESDTEMLQSLCVYRPCGDVRLWEGLVAMLRLGSVVIFWPGGPPVVAEGMDATSLPQDMLGALGHAKSVQSAEDLLALVRAS